MLALAVCGLPTTPAVAQTRALFSTENAAAGVTAASAAAVRRVRTADADLTLLAAPDQAGAPARAARSVDLNLFDDTRLVALLDHVEIGPLGYAWVGSVAGVAESTVVLGVSEGMLAGTISLPKAVYTVSRAGGRYAVAEIVRSALPRESLPIDVSAQRLAIHAADRLASADPGDVLDVLVLYTPQARSDAGGAASIDARITAAVAEANQAYTASRIPIRLNLAAAVEYDYVESGHTSIDLDAVQKSDRARALRDRYNADLVTLILASADAGGQAFLMAGADPGFAPFAFSVVVSYPLAGLYNFAHELGHNMGCNHAPDDGGNGAGAAPYAFAYKDLLHAFTTIMSYPCDGCTQINQFSSSVATYQGHPTGTPSQDAARAIAEVRTVVANFRQSSAAPVGAPSNLAASVADASVSLTWDPPLVGSPTGYRIEIGSAAGLADIGSVTTGTTTRFTAAGVTGGEYWARVRAIDGHGASDPSNEVVVTVGCRPSPATPAGLAAAVSGRSTVTITWSASAGATGYVLEAGRARGSSDLSVIEIHGTPTFSATNVDRGVYYVRVRAQNACGVSAPSADAVVEIQ